MAQVQSISAAVARKMFAQSARPHKYRAQRTVAADGTKYASRREAAYCERLKLEERAGEITDLVLQPSYPLVVNGRLVATYIADARFVDRAGCVHVIDVKGVRTREYVIKRKLFEALHAPLKVEEV